MRTRRGRLASEAEKKETTIVIDEEDASADGTKRTYLNISGDAVETCTARAAALRLQRARKRPRLTLGTWRTLEQYQNPDREKKIVDILRGRSILPIKRHVVAGLPPDRKMLEGITLQDLQTCHVKRVLSSSVIDWLLANINSLPQLGDVLIYPTCFVPFVEGRKADPVLEQQIQEWERDPEREDQNRRPLMNYGKVLIPFCTSQKTWCLAYLQPAIDRRIRVYSTLSGSRVQKAPQIRHIQTFMKEQHGQRYNSMERGSCPWKIELAEGLPKPNKECDDSGAFLCAYAKALVTGQDPRLVTSEAVNEIRWRIQMLGLELASAT